MGRFKMLFLAVCLLWTCLIGACRTTESELYSPVPIPTGPYTALSPETDASSRPISTGSKIPFLLLTAAILIGLIMVFASDKKPKKRKTPQSQYPRRSAKRVKKAEQ